MCLFLIKYLWTNFINIRRSFSYCEISILLSSRILALFLVDLVKCSLCLHRIYSTYLRFDLIRTCLSNRLHNCIKNPSHTTRPPKLISAIFSQVQSPFAQYLEFIVLTRLFCRRMLTTLMMLKCIKFDGSLMKKKTILDVFRNIEWSVLKICKSLWCHRYYSNWPCEYFGAILLIPIDFAMVQATN